ncbi:MAG: tetratricopeptide repeat protein, partial [Schwartzia sp.]|nr:tetratricopeptide repeat protein [Schwartzia sp. (in: firmicutes)]
EYAYYYGGELGQAMLMDSNNVIGEPSAVLFRRDDLKHHYFHAESRGYYVLSDVAMWLELLEQGDAVIFRDPLSYYRWHEEQEGRQPDVILLARIEWFGLMKEYYERGIYLKERGDYVRAVRGLVQDAEKHLLKKALPHASEEMKKRYMACLDEMRGIAPSGHERYMRQMRAKNIFFGALEELQRKKYKDAVNIMSSFQKCMSDDGENTPFWNMYYMGLAEYGLGNYSEAEGLFYGYLNAVPMAIMDETAWFYLGNACAREGKWRAAVAAYDKATKIRPRFFEADTNRKLIEQKLRKNDNGSAMSAPQGGKLEIAEEIMSGSYALPKGYSIFDIPIFINCRDRVLCLKRLLGWLIEAGYRNIYLLDNDSTYGPLLEYYDEIAKNKNIKVIRLGKNYGFTALWLSGTLRRLGIVTPYIYTDPDVVPSESCPKDFVKALWDILEKYPFIKKAGPGLIYDDITYFNRDNTVAWESQWYEAEIEKGRHFASIDTTLALYRNYYHYSLDISVRTSGDVMMRHLPWYYDMDNLPEDESYYMEHATSAASIKTEHEKNGNK